MKTNFSFLIIITVLIAIIFLQRECNNPKPCPPCTITTDTIRVVDTIWVPMKIIKKTKPVLKESIKPNSIDQKYIITDTSKTSLQKKYNDVVEEISTKRVYEDVIELDLIGHITVTDTIQHNRIQNRTAVATFKIPKIKEIVYIKEQVLTPPSRQLYIGGGISTSRLLSNSTAQVGLLFKTKQDNIYNGTVGMTIDGTVMFGVQSYWKIKLGK